MLLRLAASMRYSSCASVESVEQPWPSTIGRGLRGLAAKASVDPRRARRRGGGRRPLTETDPGLLPVFLSLVEPDERGDPMSPLRCTCKSLRHLANESASMGHKASRTVIGQLLRAGTFSLRGNRKTEEGGDHEDRDAQFLHINECVTAAMAANQPATSVDAKKKELVGKFKNNGQEWRLREAPRRSGRMTS
jgi:hypothetical protein